MCLEKRIESESVHACIRTMVDKIASRHQTTDNLAIVGVADGGIPFAQILKNRIETILGRPIAIGQIDSSFHRDDIGSQPIPKEFQRTDISFSVDDATILLVDDVLYTGRTARAAINEIFDTGRPRKVELIVLCDRGNRCLPIQPDDTGFTFESTADEDVIVTLHPEKPDDDSIVIRKV